MVNVYKSPMRFLEICNPSMQFKLRERGADFYMCKEMDAPMMKEVREVFGLETLLTWVGVLVDNLNDFCGVKEKMSKEQKDEVAHILSCEFGYLNIAEVSMMFMKMKEGEGGEFFGCVDAVKFLSGFKKIDAIRRREIAVRKEKMENEMKMREMEEWRKNAMPIEEVKKKIDSGEWKNLGALGLDKIIGG